MRHIQLNNGHYLIASLPFHKSLEMGYQDSFSKHFELDMGLTFSGRDHAGFQFSIQLWGWFLFEFNLTDTRHWSYQANRWMTPEEVADHAQVSQALADAGCKPNGAT